MREGKIGVKEITSLIIAREFDEVILEHPHEDGGQEAGEKQHRHAGVDDAEPVDLHSRPRAGLWLIPMRHTCKDYITSFRCTKESPSMPANS